MQGQGQGERQGDDGDFVVLPAAREPSGRSPRLEAILTADGARERARALRGVLVGLLAILGLPLWLTVVWPGKLSPDLRTFAATLWALGAAGLVLAAGWERLWSWRRSARVAALGPLPMLRSERRAGGACAARPEAED